MCTLVQHRAQSVVSKWGYMARKRVPPGDNGPQSPQHCTRSSSAAAGCPIAYSFRWCMFACEPKFLMLLPSCACPFPAVRQEPDGVRVRRGRRRRGEERAGRHLLRPWVWDRGGCGRGGGGARGGRGCCWGSGRAGDGAGLRGSGGADVGEGLVTWVVLEELRGGSFLCIMWIVVL